MTDIITPQKVEARLYQLSAEIDTAHDELNAAETIYLNNKAKYEIDMARSRLEYAYQSSPTGKNYTVGEREDKALVENQEAHLAMATAEIVVKSARANAARLRIQVDIARSIGTSVRTGMDSPSNSA